MPGTDVWYAAIRALGMLLRAFWVCSYQERMTWQQQSQPRTACFSEPSFRAARARQSVRTVFARQRVHCFRTRHRRARGTSCACFQRDGFNSPFCMAHHACNPPQAPRKLTVPSHTGAALNSESHQSTLSMSVLPPLGDVRY